jgi:hypothetical protein
VFARVSRLRREDDDDESRVANKSPTILQPRNRRRVGGDVDVPRIGDVASERRDRTRTARVGLVLRHDAQEGQHGDSPVGEFLALQRFEILPLGESRRVEFAPRVQAFLGGRGTALRLGKRHQERVQTNHGEQRRVRLVSEVFRRAVPRRRLRLDPGAVPRDLDGDGAGDAEHGPTRVHEFSLAVSRQVFRLFTELERVEPVIAAEEEEKQSQSQSLSLVSLARYHIYPPRDGMK